MSTTSLFRVVKREEVRPKSVLADCQRPLVERLRRLSAARRALLLGKVVEQGRRRGMLVTVRLSREDDSYNATGQ